jgi:hypothetical protein
MNSFWAAIETQLDELRTAVTADDVLRILTVAPGTSSGDGFFAGGGGDGTVLESLTDAGWVLVWMEAPYYWVAQAPNGDLITYVEGDIYRGDQRPRSE